MALPVIIQAQTSATGATFVAFPSQPCKEMQIVNLTGAQIEYCYNGTGNAIGIPTGASKYVLDIQNANQVSIRRSDQSNTQVTVSAECFFEEGW